MHAPRLKVVESCAINYYFFAGVRIGGRDTLPIPHRQYLQKGKWPHTPTLLPRRTVVTWRGGGGGGGHFTSAWWSQNCPPPIIDTSAGWAYREGTLEHAGCACMVCVTWLNFWPRDSIQRVLSLHVCGRYTYLWSLGLLLGLVPWLQALYWKLSWSPMAEWIATQRNVSRVIASDDKKWYVSEEITSEELPHWVLCSWTSALILAQYF
jgi:hypothetical protein